MLLREESDHTWKNVGNDFLNDLGDNADEYVEEFINKIFIVK